MKKVFFIAVLAVFGITATQAQEVRLGAKGGVNFSSLSGKGFDAFDDPEGRTSFHLGLLAEIPLSERFSIQPEVLYSGQGFDLVSREGADDTEVQLDYINVPVMAKVYIVEGLYAEAGPQIGFNVKNEIDSDPDDFGSGETELDGDMFNDVDFSVGVGAGYRFNNGLFLNARYNFGLSDIVNNEDLPVEVDAKNTVFAVSAGYSF
ncbi:porin family protein [Marixanthomonas spongiae]|uniref:PorT family protein n=1 Tax=Marixanthomonas spongiae TaxID=2174845 RepID=A0A2U0I3J6_9FLAO|nr:porin family protein [Marixanthomonas spongiae]PVW15685.1 PorT family protein [Marixanthomonas spongiae]